ncbi:hypothetical protein MQA17_25420 [Escherichia coli]|nr:hypothetical protein [Escherichia coli]
MERSKIFNMKLFILSAVLIATLNAQTTTNPTLTAILHDLRQVFNAIDADRNNVIDHNEPDQYFRTVDTDNDNCLSYDEFTRSRQGLTDSQEDILRATYLFYDEVAGSEPANGCIAHRDIQDLFGLLDLDDNREITINEFDTGNFLIAEAILASLSAIQGGTTVAK